MQILENLHAFIWRSPAANNCNSYLIDGHKHVLIDPGHMQFFNHVEQGLQKIGLTPEDIDLVLCTHAHPDHIEAVQLLKSQGAKFALHAEEWELVKAVAPQLKLTMGLELDDFQPDFFLQAGDLQVGDVNLHVLHTPGHSPGSICFHWQRNKALITGDLVFKDGVGRTDLPGGDTQELKQSIGKVAQLSLEHLLPGHGDTISGAKRVQTNFENIGQAFLNYI